MSGPTATLKTPQLSPKPSLHRRARALSSVSGIGEPFQFELPELPSELSQISLATLPDMVPITSPSPSFKQPHTESKSLRTPSNDKHRHRTILKRRASTQSQESNIILPELPPLLPLDPIPRTRVRASSSIATHYSPSQSQPIDLFPAASDVVIPTQMPTSIDLHRASLLPVISSTGQRVPFGNLFRTTTRKTILIFIRHFLCPACQDYMRSVRETLKVFSDEGTTEHRGVEGLKVVVIGSGDWEMIQGYEKISKSGPTFGIPDLAVYTDPTLQLQTLFGLHRLGKTSSASSIADEGGSYVRHKSLISGIRMVLKNVVKNDMPILTKNKGSTSQLGGEFILEPGLKCTFAHRMTTPTSHLPFSELLLHAGLYLPPSRKRGSMVSEGSITTIGNNFSQPSTPRKGALGLSTEVLSSADDCHCGVKQSFDGSVVEEEVYVEEMVDVNVLGPDFIPFLEARMTSLSSSDY
ncbi:hypothetical protein DL96DRAFT_1556959 [Flagelloscypha sp. PMI_526]|nr:hypothetical protein DL96DRAFT_1556959 [Flagelloscypha sp. PMI_526]